MAIDPVALVQQMRPGPSPEASSFTPERGAMRRRRDTIIEDSQGNQRTTAELSGAPGTRNFKAGVGNPPCATCQSDHNPIKERLGEYDHEYLHPDKANGAGLVVLSAGAVPAVETPSVAPGGLVVGAAQRVSIIPGRGEDTFIVAIECAPDWDLVDSWKFQTSPLLEMLPVLRKLGIKIRDNTAGELAALQAERDARKPA